MVEEINNGVYTAAWQEDRWLQDNIKLCKKMEQRTLKNVNNHLNINIYSYLETSGGQSSTLYLNVVHFFNTSINYTSVAA